MWGSPPGVFAADVESMAISWDLRMLLLSRNPIDGWWRSDVTDVATKSICGDSDSGISVVIPFVGRMAASDSGISGFQDFEDNHPLGERIATDVDDVARFSRNSFRWEDGGFGLRDFGISGFQDFRISGCRGQPSSRRTDCD